MNKTTLALILAAVVLLASCKPGADVEHSVSVIESTGSITIQADVWADNWFAFYLGEQLILEDSIAITTERSFNGESFTFNADYPMQLNFIAKDFKENDTGLEYIGARNQQMGDGGLIAQFINSADSQLIAATDSSWKCLVIHEAPLNKSCEASSSPIAGEAPCDFRSSAEPAGWKSLDFDDSTWANAIEHSTSAVRPKGGYDVIDWQEQASLVWSEDLETHNTLLCRVTIRE